MPIDAAEIHKIERRPRFFSNCPGNVSDKQAACSREITGAYGPMNGVNRSGEGERQISSLAALFYQITSSQSPVLRDTCVHTSWAQYRRMAPESPDVSWDTLGERGEKIAAEFRRQIRPNRKRAEGMALKVQNPVS